MIRCGWCGSDPLYVRYHDEVWGVPVREDQLLFENLVLDGAQAGLSWFTILKKRENYRRAFHFFDIERVAAYTEEDEVRLLGDVGIVRNRQKIRSAINNARRVLDVQAELGSFSDYLWSFTGGRSIQNSWKTLFEVPTTSTESDAMSKDMKRRGFSFAGSTICYAFMQAVGMVNDHLTDCFRYKEVRKPGIGE
ncbi:MAG: DNA-3-methyladenine glycosylase [Spirochaeta sp. LUC14_002_19_P3]|nr:MAG: DNA-3-methyladenine glycosylase [Spirochaeta sp. LUC14_002_19_P3]